MILGFMGSAGSGKDTIALKLNSLLNDSNIKCGRYAFADPVKDVASIITGSSRHLFDNQNFKTNNYFSLTDGHVYNTMDLPPKHNLITIRELLQKIGTEGMQSILGKNVWINKIMTKIEEDTFFDISIITDVRFKTEYKKIKSKNGIIIKVLNPLVINKDSHISENDLNGYPADYTVINDWQNNVNTVDERVKQLAQIIKEEYESN